MADATELLFFDTFSHENSEELNLDLVQFPKSVYVSEIRIIPLGAKVQGDFPGGVRLGATNPTQFHVDFFVNDLSKPGASTFESLGGLDYCQNGAIHMEAIDLTHPRIPTDGLVLRGLYSTITLAVYGNLVQPLAESLITPPSNQTAQKVPKDATPSSTSVESSWIQTEAKPIPTYTSNMASSSYESVDFPNENFDNQLFRPDYYDENTPKDPRAYVIQNEENVQWLKDNQNSVINDRNLMSPVVEMDRERHNRSVDLGRDRKEGKIRMRSRSIEHDRIRARDRDREVRSRSRSREYHRIRSRSRSISRERRKYSSKEKDWDRYDEYRRKRGDSYEGSRGGSYERRISPYSKRPPSYERTGSYGKRTPPFDKRSPSYERRSPLYDKPHIYDKKNPPFERIRDSNYRSRSRSREDPRKRPRTPSEDIRRPHTPNDGRIISPPPRLSDEEVIEYDQNGKPLIKGDYYPFKHDKGIRSPSVEDINYPLPKIANYIESKSSSLITVQLVETDFSNKDHRPDGIDSQNALVEEDQEQFEPILSDEDICDDLDASYDEIDYDLDQYNGFEETVKYFNPFKSEWVQYEYRNRFQYLQTGAEVKNVTNASFRELCDLLPELANLYELTKVSHKRDQNFSFENFEELEVSKKEDWVRQSEKCVNLITNVCNNSDVMVRIFNNSDKRNDEFSEILEYLLMFFKIGLSYDCALAQVQPTYKIRHIKCGMKLCEMLLRNRHNNVVVSLLLRNGIDVSSQLFSIYFKDYMALSIRLMILRSLDAFLLSKEAFEHFFQPRKYIFKSAEKEEEITCNGYEFIVKMVQNNPLIQLKFALNNILKKVNTYELLQKFSECVSNVEGNVEVKDYEFTSQELDLCVGTSEEILKIILDCSFEISQPKRFLPASAQFEISTESTNEVIIQLCEMHNLIQCVIFLLTSPKTFNNVTLNSHMVQLLRGIIYTPEGIAYLYRHYPVSEVIFKYLTYPFSKQEVDDYFIHDISNYNETQILGLDLAHRLKIVYFLNAINDTIGDQEELVEYLRCLYSLGFGVIGKMALSELLASGDYIKHIINLFDEFKKDDSESSIKRRSPAESYAAEIIINTFKYGINAPFLKKFGADYIKIVDDRENYEPGVATILLELVPYLKPLRKLESTCDDLAEYISIIKSCTANAAECPGEMITALVVLQNLCTFNEFETESLSRREFYDLYPVYNCMKLYSLEGIPLIVAILEKICEKYDQPFMHTHTFASYNGLNIARVCLACVTLLDNMITRILKARGSQFRDTTAVGVTLKIFGLLTAFPLNCLSGKLARIAAKATVSSLLAYAQPQADDADDGECLRRGPWTILCSEVLSYTITAPHTFSSGLLAFSELLPLPLPIATSRPLTAEEIADAIADRRFWSAHLHALVGQISDVVRTLCTSTDRPVSHALRRVCVQIADLAPNTASMIARASVAAVSRELPAGRPATASGARALAFLSCLLAHAPVKCAALFAPTPPPSTRHSSPRDLTTVLSSALRVNSGQEIRAVQESAANALACLCAAEVTLSTERTPADSLPPRESLETMLDATADCLSSDVLAPSVAAAVLRAYFALTEHEYGFQAFRRFVVRRRESLTKFCRSWASGREDWWEVCAAWSELLRAGRERTSARLTRAELADAAGWAEPETLRDLLNSLKEKTADEDFVANISFLVNSLTDESEDIQDSSLIAEIILPPPSSLISQFENRTVWTIGDRNDERLTEGYWLNLPQSGVEEVTDTEMVQIDLMEIANTELSSVGGAESLMAAVRTLLGASELSGANANSSRQVSGQNTSNTHGVKDKRTFVRRPEGADAFRSRPPNTSRPPSLHVDDFLALEGRPPTAYKHNINRGARRGIAVTDRGRFASSTPQINYRPMRGGAWDMGPAQHFPHFPQTHYVFGNGWGGGRGARGRRARPAHVR